MIACFRLSQIRMEGYVNRRHVYLMLMQCDDDPICFGLSHAAPLVMPPSDTVLRESYQGMRAGFERYDPLRTVLLTAVFTQNEGRVPLPAS